MTVGWAESLGQQIADMTDEHCALRREKKRPFRHSKAHDLQCGLNGSRNGGSDTARKLDRLLGKVEG